MSQAIQRIQAAINCEDHVDLRNNAHHALADLIAERDRYKDVLMLIDAGDYEDEAEIEMLVHEALNPDK